MINKMENIHTGFPVGTGKSNKMQDIRIIQIRLNSAASNQSDKLSVDDIVGPRGQYNRGRISVPENERCILKARICL